jgi:hypothetical protein
MDRISDSPARTTFCRAGVLKMGVRIPSGALMVGY